MKKILIAIKAFGEHSVTNIVVGFLLLVFAWHCAYQVGFDIDPYSMFVGMFGFVGMDIFSYGFCKLLDKRKK